MKTGMLRALFALLISPVYLVGQSACPDSLLRDLNLVRTDTARSRTHLQLALFYWNRNWNRSVDSSLLMSQKALEESRNARFDSGIAACDKMLGIIYENNGQYILALKFSLEGLGISEKMGLRLLEQRLLNNIGLLYNDIGDYKQAINYYNRALEVARMNAGHKHVQLGNYFDNLSDAYSSNKQYDSAIAYSKLAIQSAVEYKDSILLSAALLSVGVNLIKEGEYKKALEYLMFGLTIAVKKRDEERIVWANLYISSALQPLKQNDESIRFAKIALEKARQMHLLQPGKEISHILYLNYRDKGDNRAALNYRNSEIAIGDSLFNLQKDKEIKGLQSDYELEKKQHQIDMLKKDRIIQENEISMEKDKRYLLSAVIFFLVTACFILYRSNYQKRRLNRILNIRNKEIEDKNKRLEDLNFVKNKMLSIIGHDLRSPFSALRGFLFLIRKPGLARDQTEYFIAQMNETLINTSHLLENILFWAKSQMEGMTANPTQFDLMEIISQNRKLMQARADQKKISLVVDSPESPAIAYADETMIDIVVRNLVENAIKYSSDSDVVEISISSTDRQFIEISVKDSGRGIAEADQPKILIGSVSYSTTGTLMEKGSGLGLALCKELVERNGGSIWFGSSPNSGTIFSFTVPNAAKFDL